MAQQPGFGIARIDNALDTYNRFDVAFPIRLVEQSSRFEHLNTTTFVAPTRLVMAVIRTQRGCGGNFASRLKQRRLVVFDLND
jgi:hypothetical protein